MKVEELNRVLLSQLRKIPDPMNRGSNWIYPDYPDLSLSKDDFPRISLLQVSGGGQEEVGIGRSVGGSQSGVRYVFTYQVDVWVKKGNEATIDNKLYKGAKLRDYLADRVLEYLIDRKDEIPGIEDIVLATSPLTHPYDPVFKVRRKTLTFNVIVQDTF